MTREEANEFYPILQAYAEGRVIECRTKLSALSKSWQDMNEWTEMEELEYWNNIEYRIKQQSEAKYRPFKDAEECWNEMQKHEYFGWIKAKDASIPNRFITINSVRNEEVSITSGIDFTYNELVEHYTFIDRTTFGIKEEE